MIAYSQATGKIYLPNMLLGVGYSGAGEGVNNPAMEAVQKVGPIPRGKWKIVRWDTRHGNKGPQVAVLAPVGHDAHGRTAFLIHGDNTTPDPRDGSHGCIVASRAIRNALRASGETELIVT